METINDNIEIIMDSDWEARDSALEILQICDASILDCGISNF